MLRWVSDKSLSRYFKEIMRYPLLTREEEAEIAHYARLGDVILKVNGVSCNSPRTIVSQVKKIGSGGKLELEIMRDKKKDQVSVEIPTLLPQSAPGAAILGMKFTKVEDMEADAKTRLGTKKGLMLADVEAGSPAAHADLRDYNRKGRDKLILHNLRWVVSIAKQYQNRGLQLAELINEGNLGLIQAVSKFDVNRKTRLTTYSNWWIRYYIVSALASRHLIKLPIKMRNLAKKIRDSYGKLAQRFGRTPSIEELAKELNVTSEEVSAAFDCGVAELSIDAMPFDDSKVTFEEVLRDTSSPSPAEVSAKDEIERNVRSSLNDVLADRELYVVSRHFGVPLPRDRKFTLPKISAIFGKSQPDINHIMCKASRKILSSLNVGLGEDGLKRYAKLTANDIGILPEVLKKGLDFSTTALLKLTRKVVRNIPFILSDHLEELDLEGQEIFCLYWQVNPPREELNLRELGDLLGVSREAARQVKERAIKKLKKQLRPQAFDNFFREAV